MNTFRNVIILLFLGWVLGIITIASLGNENRWYKKGFKDGMSSTVKIKTNIIISTNYNYGIIK